MNIIISSCKSQTSLRTSPKPSHRTLARNGISVSSASKSWSRDMKYPKLKPLFHTKHVFTAVLVKCFTFWTALQSISWLMIKLRKTILSKACFTKVKKWSPSLERPIRVKFRFPSVITLVKLNVSSSTITYVVQELLTAFHSHQLCLPLLQCEVIQWWWQTCRSHII